MRALRSFFFQAEDGIRDLTVTGVQTCALPIFAPSGLAATCSTSNAPGVSSVARPPSAGTEYRCVHPSFSQGNTIRSPAPHRIWFGATISRNTLPRPVSAVHTWRPPPPPPPPLARAAPRLDHGSPARRGVDRR